MSQNAVGTSGESFPIPTMIAVPPVQVDVWLGRYAKAVALLTLLLIFFGGQVKSHEAGLSVPDWPLTYNQNPITFPLSSWVGGIWYEHSHRLLGGCVSAASVLLALWVHRTEKRVWLRKLAYVSAGAVLVQALLGGVTVLLHLPVWTSSSHALLAQTFLLINVALAYSLSQERAERVAALAPGAREVRTPLLTGALVLIGLLYVQLLLGALTRHTESGLAIPDFPTTAGQWIPSFNQATVDKINALREGQSDASGTPLDPVALYQIVLQFMHRVGALFIVAVIAMLAWLSMRYEKTHPQLMTLAYLLCGTVLAQFVLGMTIVLTMRSPTVASLHVMVGAATLAIAGLLALRAWPLAGEDRDA